MCCDPVHPNTWVKLKLEPEEVIEKILEEMTQLNKSLLMNDACPQSPSALMEKESKAGWLLGCCVCMVQDKVGVFTEQLSLISVFISLCSSQMHSVSHSQIWKKNQFLVELLLYKTPLSLCSHSYLKNGPS